MKILVSGGTTFVSKFTAEYFLKRNNEVYVINRNSRAQLDGVHLINCDRMNLKNLLKDKHFDLIIDVTAYNKAHIESLLNSGVTFDDYIFISSSAVYPETNSQPFTEEQTCGKNSVWGDYGVNKLMAENYLLEHCTNAYILRPPYFYGIYENLYREAFPFDCAEKGRKFYIPQNGDMKLQFYNNHIYNVGNSDIITVKEWVKLCYKAAGKIPEFVEVDKSVQQRDYFWFYDYEYILDVKKQNELMPTTIPLEVGLKEEYEWYKNNYNSVYNRKPYIEFIDKNLK